MQRTTITIGARSWYLPFSRDIDAVKADVLSAIDDGAGFVTLPLPGARATTVLITAATTVIIETSTYPDDLSDFDDLDEGAYNLNMPDIETML